MHDNNDDQRPMRLGDTLPGLCSVLTILPFAVYRFMTGDIVVGLVDLAIVAGFGVFVTYAWKSGRSMLAGNITAAIATVGTCVAVLGLGLSTNWVFGCLAANFLMADRRFAMAASTLLIGVVAFNPGLFASTLDRTTFVAVAVMMSLFNLIFAWRVDSQHRQLDDIASRDPLTGALNRRAMNMDLNAVIEQVRRSPETVSVAILDLDFFKRLNDRYGHEAGDRVLVRLVDIVRGSVRRGDQFYRFGGEEFVLLLPGAGPRGLRGKPGSQGVPAVLRRVQSRPLCRFFDDVGNGLSRECVVAKIVPAVNAPKKRSVVDLRDVQPRPQRPNRTRERILAVVDAFGVAASFLVGFARSDNQTHAFGREADIGRCQLRNFAAAKGAGEAHEKNGTVSKSRQGKLIVFAVGRKTLDHQPNVFGESRGNLIRSPGLRPNNPTPN